MPDLIDTVLDRLEGVRKQGGGYRARCPVHGSKGPTLALTEGDDGRVLIHCHAGCSPGAVREALDLPWSAFFPAGSGRTRKRRKMDRRNVELEALMLADRLQSESDVLAELERRRGWSADALRELGVGWDGERLTLPSYGKDGELHDVLRYAPFLTRGAKMLAGFGRSRTLWPAPESVDTAYKARFLFVVEGEGTAISLWSLGLPAVACPGSVTKGSGDVRRPGRYEGSGWQRTWGERFSRHKRIALIPDCDSPGRLLMRAAEYDLTRHGVSVTTVDLAPDRDDGKDVGDWARPFTSVQRRLARDLLVALIDTAARRPAELDYMRALTVGFSRFEASGGEAGSVAAPTSVSPPEPSTAEVPWDWRAEA